MAATDHYKYMYEDAVGLLANSQNRSILKEFTSQKSKAGEAVFFDDIDVDDSTDADETAIASLTEQYKEDYDALTSPAVSDLYALLTPHHKVTKQRTMCTPYKLDTGYQFRDKDEMAQNATERSEILQARMRKIFKKEDNLILTALSASTQNRGKTGTSSVSFPAAQKLGVATTITAFTKDVCAQILEIYEGNYADDQRIFCVISPRTKRELIEQSGDKIHSSDFVSRRHLEMGTLPDIYGVCMLVHPLVSDSAFYAWQPSAIVYNTFKPREVHVGQNAAMRYLWEIYIAQMHGCCRRDDNRVVQGTITRST